VIKSISISKGLILFVKVLTLFEGSVEGKHHMQRFDKGIRKTLINRDIKDTAGNFAIISKAEIDFFAWSCN
jgi:hypothetical protein